MRLLTLSLTLALLSGCTSACSKQDLGPQSDRPLKVIALLGQSNMSGRGALSEKHEGPPNGAHLWNFADGKWIRAEDPLDQDDPGAGVGPGLTLASDLSLALGTDIGIVQCAKGGTSIDQWTQTLFAQCLAQIKAATAKAELVGVFWHQGESDAYSDEAARTWPTKFDALNAQFKVPVVYAQLATISTARQQDVRFAHWDLVKRMQVEAKGILVQTSDLALGPDGLHLSTASAIELGHRMAEAFITKRGE